MENMKTFPLLKGEKQSKEFNIAKVNSIKRVTLNTTNAQFERRREKAPIELQEEDKDDDFEKNKESKKMARKTRSVQNVEVDDLALRAKECRKWLLTVEDDSQQFEFEGQLLNHDMTHCLFIVEKNGFRVIPADSLYQFNPKRPSTITLEEAEKLIQQRQQELKKLNKFDEIERKDFKIVDSGTQNIKIAGSDDELDYDIDQEFADDEEGIAPIESEVQLEKQKKDLQKLRQSEEENSDDDKPSLNQSGKELKKLLKDKNVQVAGDESDENPFNSDISEDLPDEESIKESPNNKDHNLGKKRLGDPDLSLMVKRHKSESQYSVSVQAPRVVVDNKLTEQEVIDLIAAQPGLTTKDLLKPLKSKIKANVENRELIRDILKKVANVKQGKIYLK
eukprot:NODE_278_length_11936_cov_0.473644.p1 type:complete len:392 gc:universal NODE_278_length_11936_cov_0.473644:1130-2305(+)